MIKKCYFIFFKHKNELTQKCIKFFKKFSILNKEFKNYNDLKAKF
jgi:hypothetical protein